MPRPQPFASSSKVTLDDLAELDSLRAGLVSPPSSAPLRRRSRRLGRRTVGTVLALCIPYIAAANPLPHSDSRHLPASPHSHSRHGVSPPCHQSSGTSSASNAMGVVVSAAERLATHLLPIRAAPDRILTIATRDLSGLYTVPEGYVTLVQRFQPGFIVLSYVIAFFGSLCTLELLIRRTTNSGWRNQVLLALAGFCFGAVSTFSMHFVFNNSLTLSNPVDGTGNVIYLMYGAGFTVLSLIASITAMTIAFFVMGTRVSDWYCVPGKRRRRSSAREEAERRSSDEYMKWKSTHNNMFRKGSMGVGALMAHASRVAKWSLVDGPRDPDALSSNRSWKSWGSKKEDLAEKDYDENDHQFDGDTEDDMIRKDKQLSELDFRFGRSAVKTELERRERKNDFATASSMTNSPVVPSGPNDSSIRLMPSNSSLPKSPLPVYYPTGIRRGSVPIDIATTEVFAPGFSFPARINTNITPPPAALPAPSSAPPVDGNGSFWPNVSSPLEPVLQTGYDLSRRRASLPVAILSREQPQPPAAASYNTTLSRIQSLPEADFESPPTAPSSPSLGQVMEKSSVSAEQKSLAMTVTPAELNTLEEDPAQGLRKKAQPTLSRLEKFLGFDVVTRAEIAKIFLTGTIAGFGVVGMHYIGQASITGIPYIAYKPAYVVGSVIIAAGAVIIALYIMFIMLRPKLKHNWASKIVVAAILAIAVCCMHFCGMMGTIYAWPANTAITKHDMFTGANRAITAIVASLAFGACVGCAVFFVIESIRARRERQRRRRVVVASILMDPNDRILVNSTDGLPPMCDIASLSTADVPSPRKSLDQSLNSGSTILGMDLTSGHEAFVSALKLSWYWRNPRWNVVNPLGAPSTGSLPPIASVSNSIAEIRRGSLNTTTSTVMSRPARISVAKFLERFVVSAGQLAVRLTGQQDGISRIGVLYDQILTTGWVKLRDNSNDTVSKGQLIFLVRRVTSPDERTDLLARHFIWADGLAVAASLTKTLSVPAQHLIPLLEDVRVFCDSTLRPSLKPATLYAGVAVVQATPFDGLRILLEQDNRSQVPMRELCTFTPQGAVSASADPLLGTVEEIGEALTWLDGMNLLAVITRNMQSDANEALGGRRAAALLDNLERALVPMLDEMLSSDDMAHILPRLTLHPVLVPLTPGPHKTTNPAGYVPPHMIVFYANYDAAVNTFTDKWLPFSLFRAQNACVMAPKIALASKLEVVGNGNGVGVSSLNGAGASSIGFGTTSQASFDLPPIETRRPSRVQFEFPPAQITPSPATAMSDTIAAPSPIFGGFTFPPKDQPKDIGNGNGNSNGNGNGNNNGNGDTDYPMAPLTAYTPATPTSTPTPAVPMHRSLSKSAPRRSSLARTKYPAAAASAYDDPLSSGGPGSSKTRDSFLPPTDRAPGVASWHPDWLVNLLRTKLRADA